MGFLDTLFGGTDTSAQESQIQSNREAQEFIRERAAEARRDVLALFPGIEQNQLTGIQGAFDVLGQTIPQQVGAFQAGNVGAQQTLLAGLPQQQNALLGLPTDLSGLQAQQIPVDLGFAQQQVPQFQQAIPALEAALAAEQQAAPPTVPVNFGQGSRGQIGQRLTDLAIQSQSGNLQNVSPADQARIDQRLRDAFEAGEF